MLFSNPVVDDERYGIIDCAGLVDHVMCLQEIHAAQTVAAEQLVAMELKCEELRRAADDAEMASDSLLSIFSAHHSGYNVRCSELT